LAVPGGADRLDPDLLAAAAALLEDHPEGDLAESQVLADAVAQVVFVRPGQERLVVDREHERWRSGVDLTHVEELERPALEVGWSLAHHPGLEPGVEFARRDAAPGAVVQPDGRGQQL